MKCAALAILGRMCHCSALISQRLLSIALLSNGSRSSIRKGSPAPVHASETISPSPCGWSISRLSPGCRSSKLPTKSRIIRMSSGGATNVKRASRFANAATNASGKCLERKKRNCIHRWVTSFILLRNSQLHARFFRWRTYSTYVELRNRSDK